MTAVQPSPLSVDLYELNMVQAYLDQSRDAVAVFEFFIRRLPARRGFLLAAGLDTALDYLETLRFSSEEIAWLKSTGRFNARLLDYLASFRFTGDVHALPEGTAFFPHEPMLRITAPLPQAQLVESRLINILHFQTIIASKAARMTLAAQGKNLVDFGLRYAHGAEAGLLAARADYIAGFAGAANVEAGMKLGIPLYGTMAHSFIQVHDNEITALENFARARPDNVLLLIDTYDTEAGARKVVELAPRLKADGIAIRGVRIDSGDLIEMSRKVRGILDDGGLNDLTIFVSGGIDEDTLTKILASGAPIDGYGVGTSLTTSVDAPALDCAYKLQEYDGGPRRKRSEGKQTWPGRKQVWRKFLNDEMSGDTLSVETDKADGEPLIEPVMLGGKRVGQRPALAELRARAAQNLKSLPPPLRSLRVDTSYPVEIAPALKELAAIADKVRQ